MEELVVNFTTGRETLLKFAKEAAQLAQADADSTRPMKRRKITAEQHISNGDARRSTRSQTRRGTSHPTTSQLSVQSTADEVADSDNEGSIYEDHPSRHFGGASDGASDEVDGLVACPSCSRRMKEPLINAHLDRCLNGTATPEPSHPVSSQRPHQIESGKIAYTQTKPSHSTNRLPTLNYSILTDTALRKKLKELGINSMGSKTLLQKRHTEWVNLWNANCDSLHPVSKREMLAKLDSWDRTLGRQVERAGGPSGVMVKDFDREGYAQARKGEFEELIAKARERRKGAPSAEGEQVKMDDVPAIEQEAVQVVKESPVKKAEGVHDHDIMADSQLDVGNPYTNGVRSTDDKVVDLTSPQKSLSQRLSQHGIDDIV